MIKKNSWCFSIKTKCLPHKKISNFEGFEKSQATIAFETHPSKNKPWLVVLKKLKEFFEKVFLFSQKKHILVVSCIDKRYYLLTRYLEKSRLVWRFWKVLLKFRQTKNIEFSASNPKDWKFWETAFEKIEGFFQKKLIYFPKKNSFWINLGNLKQFNRLRRILKSFCQTWRFPFFKDFFSEKTCSFPKK